MRYLVTGRLKKGRAAALLQAIKDRTLGRGSVAEGEYLRDMEKARALEDGQVRWVEVCFCPEPLQEERPYWEQYFELTQIKNAHARHKCRDLNGEEPWACSHCDCTERLESRMDEWGQPFSDALKAQQTNWPGRPQSGKRTDSGKR